MLFTSFCNTDTFTFSQVEIIDVRNSPTLLYCFPPAYTVRHKILQRFSMGFRSGKFAGHSITCTPFSKNHSHVEFATWLEALSCWNIQNGPPIASPKGKTADLADLGKQLHSSGLQGMQYSFGLDNETQPTPLVTVLIVGAWKRSSPLSTNRANNRLHHLARLNWISFHH